MSEECEILLTTAEGQIVAGTFALDGKKIISKPKKGYERLMKNILEEDHTIDEEQVSSKEDSRSWFNTLVKHYSGTYLRARFV